ncbi:MAG: CHAT domain-containing protein [Cyanobacteria bacterium SBLK]|nr:CHAT domain-containing protein [Cyanobacteria bacterium SBLK]
MKASVVLSLGSGSFAEGFPCVSARLSDGSQVSGHLPAAPDLPGLYDRWRLLYELLYQSRLRGIEIEAGSVTNVSETAFQEISRELENKLNHWLGDDGFRGIENRVRSSFAPQDELLLTVESQDSDAWRFPWHLWSLCRQDYPHTEIALSTPDYPAPQSDRPATERGKVNILAVLGDGTGIDINGDRALLQKLPGAKPTFLIQPRREELIEKLWEKPWDILFFAGHGRSDRDATGGRIYINSQNSLTVAELQEALSHAIRRGLQLAIFNCCDGLGIARDWARAKIPLPPAIVMREAVPDAIARGFLQYFLQAYAKGASFPLAVRHARERLKGLEDCLPGASWLPAICQHPAVSAPTWAELKRDCRPRNFKLKPILPLPRLALCSLIGGLGLYVLGGQGLAVWANRTGVTHFQTNKLLQAQIFYRLASILDPFNPKPHYNLAWLCEKSHNDFQCAARGYRRAADRGLSEASSQLAKVLLNLQDPDTVWQITKHCLDSPYPAVRAACLGKRGWLLWEQGRIFEAKEHLEEAIALEPDSPHARCLYARILEGENRQEEARQHWEWVKKSAQYHIPEQNQCLQEAHPRLEENSR